MENYCSIVVTMLLLLLSTLRVMEEGSLFGGFTFFFSPQIPIEKAFGGDKFIICTIRIKLT